MLLLILLVSVVKLLIKILNIFKQQDTSSFLSKITERMF